MPDHRIAQLHDLGLRQHGVVSRAQALGLGYSDDEIAHRLAHGHWSRVAPSVYGVAPASVDPRRSLHAIVMSTGGLASHRSAAHLLGLIDNPPARPDVLVPLLGDRVAVDANVRRSRLFPDRELFRADGIPTTRIERTLIDLGSVVELPTLDEAVSRSLRTRRTTLARIEAAIAPPQYGRPGVRALRASLDLHRDHRAEMESILEAIVARAVRAGGLPEHVRQFEITVRSHRYRLDFAWPAERVYLEADGWARHVIRRVRTNDLVRQNALSSIDWLPLRCTWEMASRNASGLVEVIADTLQQRRRFRAAS